MPHEARHQRIGRTSQTLVNDLLDAARRGWAPTVLVALAHGRKDILRRACAALDTAGSESDDAVGATLGRLRGALGLATR